MRISTKFPIAVHVVMIIAALSHVRKVNSKIIAESTGVNAVIIRNIFRSLKQANIISVSPGPTGAMLARNIKDITLLDIFIAVEQTNTDDIFAFHKHPNEHCPIGSNIYGILKYHLDDSVNALKEELSKVTITMLVNELRSLLPDLPLPPDMNDDQ